MQVSLNTTQKLFVISSGYGVSALGFDKVAEDVKEYIARLRKAGQSVELPENAQPGTLEQYALYQDLGRRYAALNSDETWFSAGTPEAVKKILERYRKMSTDLRIFYGDPRTGKDWLEEYDTVGQISRSTGPQRIPLLVPAKQCGGVAILTNSIVRIVDVKQKLELYRHPQYHQPEMQLTRIPAASVRNKLTHAVMIKSNRKWEPYARFASRAAGQKWMNFITGESFQ